MDDRITEIREALEWWDDVARFDPAFMLQGFDTFVDAARAYADLLDSDTLIIRWCEEHRSSPHPDDVDQENCPVWSWEMEYRPTPPPCRMVKARLVALASSQGVTDG